MSIVKKAEAYQDREYEVMSEKVPKEGLSEAGIQLQLGLIKEIARYECEAFKKGAMYVLFEILDAMDFAPEGADIRKVVRQKADELVGKK